MKLARAEHPFPREPAYKHRRARMRWVLRWHNRGDEPRPQQGRLSARGAWLPMTGVQIAPMLLVGEVDHCPDSWPVGKIRGPDLRD